MSFENTSRTPEPVIVATPEISWSAIIAGALVTIVTSIGMVILGSGLGLATMPWYAAPGAAKITAAIVIWMVVVQWSAAAFGGYVTGRMRLRWPVLHTHEVFFRDTAHGFLAWIVATLFAAAFLASAVPMIAKAGMHAAMADQKMMSRPPQGEPQPSAVFDPLAYYVDSLYRNPVAAAGMPAADNREVKAETTRILAMDLKNDFFPEADKTYIAQMVSIHTGLAAPDASARVNDVISRIDADKQKAKAAADEGRKIGAAFSFASFLSMLVGAFIASVAAVIGGRRRDRY